MLLELEGRVLPSFIAPRAFDAGVTPISVAVGDFNGDGTLDLAAASYGDDQGNGAGVNVLLGNGDGTFQPALTFAAGIYPTAVVVGDFNGDGTLDLAVADTGDSSGHGAGVNVLLGNGDGSFQAARNFAAGSSPRSVAVGDFNGDGTIDLAVANYISSGTVSVLLGNGDGTFQTAVSYPAGGLTISVAVGDFNGDGNQDLAVANADSNDVSVLLGNGDGTFQPAQSYNAGPYPSSVAVGDLAVTHAAL
jgi:hypothetical protein